MSAKFFKLPESDKHRFRLQRFRLVVLHPGRFWPFAGGVRFST